jgi:Flp pilus assembly protein TadB
MWGAIKKGVKAVVGFGSSDTGLAAVKEVAEFIDDRKFTDEEKAKYVLEVAPHYAEFMNGTLKENTERSKTRRHLAIMVIRNWLAMLWVIIFGWLWHPEWAAFVVTIALSTALITLVLGIGAFFWGTHLLRGTKLKQE